MRLDFYRLALLAAAVCMAAGAAQAHPHVWVTMTEELLYAPDGSVTGVRHTWTFDDMFSAFAVQGLDQETNGTSTREELAPLAKVNVESLKEYAYFTYAKVNGKRQRDAFADPIDYWLAYDPKDTVLTLHFTLPFKTAVKAQALNLKSTILNFHRFRLRRQRAGAAGERAQAMHGRDREAARRKFPGNVAVRSIFADVGANKGMGASFSNRISVICP